MQFFEQRVELLCCEAAGLPVRRIAPLFWTSEMGLRLMSSTPDHIANSTIECSRLRMCVFDFGDN